MSNRAGKLSATLKALPSGIIFRPVQGSRRTEGFAPWWVSVVFPAQVCQRCNNFSAINWNRSGNWIYVSSQLVYFSSWTPCNRNCILHEHIAKFLSVREFLSPFTERKYYFVS
jgi:hypothetical protein